MKTQKIDCNDCGNRDKSIFCKLEEASLKEVSDHKIMNLYKRGQTLFHEGNPAFGVYCISNGKVKLTKTSENGKETLLRIAGPGDLIGFQHIVESGMNDVTATAIEETKICFVDRSYLQGLVQKEPSCAMELLGHVARDMAALQERISGFQNKNVRERVAFMLLDLSERYGEDTKQGRKLCIQLTREDMASMLGVATETLIREISTLKDEGILDQEGKVIFLKDLKELKATIGA
ncbi:MAG: Crp/Fnr family transcriptional regulator [Bacteriovoracaceae bacterium]|nr:Crp/Fnr family transcriptional regulator [Bacteriovoracaceae bacterium]